MVPILLPLWIAFRPVYKTSSAAYVRVDDGEVTFNDRPGKPRTQFIAELRSGETIQVSADGHATVVRLHQVKKTDDKPLKRGEKLKIDSLPVKPNCLTESEYSDRFKADSSQLYALVDTSPVSLGGREYFRLRTSALTASATGPQPWDINGTRICIIASRASGLSPARRIEKYEQNLTGVMNLLPGSLLKPSEIKTVVSDSGTYVAVNRYLLMKATPADGQITNTSHQALAAKWSSNLKKVISESAKDPADGSKK